MSHNILHFLGGHPLEGVLAVLVAGVASTIWEYLRLKGAARWLTYLSLVRGVAVIATILSVVLMVSRFILVERGG